MRSLFCATLCALALSSISALDGKEWDKDSKELKVLFENNQKWVEEKLSSDPLYFTSRAKKQSPHYLWIGCSDSRIPADDLLRLEPGELFVHRNIANLFYEIDTNALAVIEYSIYGLGIEHIIVCGHTGCGGVIAAMEDIALPYVDNWLSSVRETYSQFREEIDKIKDKEKQQDMLVELNVKRQVVNLCRCKIVQNAWKQDKRVCIHGWIFDLKEGKLRDLNYTICSPIDLESHLFPN